MNAQIEGMVVDHLVGNFGMDPDDARPLTEFVLSMLENGKGALHINEELGKMVPNYDPAFGSWVAEAAQSGGVPTMGTEHDLSAAAAATSTTDMVDNWDDLAAQQHQQQESAFAGEHVAQQLSSNAFQSAASTESPRPAKPARHTHKSVASRVSIVGSSHRTGGDSPSHRSSGPDGAGLRGNGRVGKTKPVNRGSVFSRLGARPNVARAINEVFPNTAPLMFPPGGISHHAASPRRGDHVLRDAQNRKIRCPRWPNCTRPERDSCNYHHPEKLCPHLPNCRFTAETCNFIHPAMDSQPFAVGGAGGPRPCRFGANCRNFQCTFDHPPNRPPVEKPLPMCRYHPNCLDPGCKFSHPGRTSITTTRIPVLCRNGAQCTQEGCNFTHPGQAVIKCKFGVHCSRRAECPYEHPTEAEAMASGASSFTPQTSHISDRSFTIEGSDAMDTELATGGADNLVIDAN